MCGIFGIISNKEINTNKLKSVSKTISHRGPDDEGYLLFNTNNQRYQQLSRDNTIKEMSFAQLGEGKGFNSAFLHRRLSIIDLSPTGHQPMRYGNGNLWIILNG